MPIHDWTRAYPGLFHDFHQAWTIELRNALNRGLLPKGYSALADQRAAGVIPDVLTVQGQPRNGSPRERTGGAVITAEPPQTQFVRQTAAEDYADRADRIAVHHPLGDVIAVIEIVSPGNKAGRAALRSFVEKSADLLQRGVHLLVIDLFPPTPRDPGGIHKAIWDEFEEEPFDLPAGKPLTLVAYKAARPFTAYIQPVGFGDTLPDMPLYLDPEGYVRVPLESTYRATWDACPEALREAVTASATGP